MDGKRKSRHCIIMCCQYLFRPSILSTCDWYLYKFAFIVLYIQLGSKAHRLFREDGCIWHVDPNHSLFRWYSYSIIYKVNGDSVS